jgi:hypothetical protein
MQDRIGMHEGRAVAGRRGIQRLDRQRLGAVIDRAAIGNQARTYLAKATPAERSSYLQEIGTAQRFEALNAEDQASVLAGYIRKGMSAEAVRFLWGEPAYTAGYTGHYERWIYAGSALDLAESGNHYRDAGTRVEVQLTDGLVDWWFEGVPDSDDDAGESEDPQRF